MPELNILATRTYIGIGITPQGCAVITVGASQDNRGAYNLARNWYSRLTTYDGIINEVIEALKIRETPREELSKQKLELLESGKINQNKFDVANHAPTLVHHFYSLVTFPEPKIEYELRKLNPRCKDPQQNIICTVSNPLYQKEILINCTAGLINDNKIQYDVAFDIASIRDEISTITEPEDFNRMSPQLLALCLSLGEAEFRNVDQREDNGYSIRNSTLRARQIETFNPFGIF